MRDLELEQLVESLRDQVLGQLHLGLPGGDRLPSIREIARRFEFDQRKVARAYAVLQDEGLVEIRGRSGVYVRPQGRLACGMLEETAEWLAGVMLDGWKRRIRLPALPALLAQYATAAPLRCAFVDSCTDAIEAFTYELRHDLGLDVTPVNLNALRRLEWARPEDRIGSSSALRAADVLITTVFSATAVGILARRLDKPVITVSLHPEARAAVVRRLRGADLTVVCADPSFGDRIRSQYAEHIVHAGQVRVVPAGDSEALKRLDPKEPVLLTRAARIRGPEISAPMLIPHSPTLSPASAHEIVRHLIRATSRSVSSGVQGGGGKAAISSSAPRTRAS